MLLMVSGSMKHAVGVCTETYPLVVVQVKHKQAIALLDSFDSQSVPFHICRHGVPRQTTRSPGTGNLSFKLSSNRCAEWFG